jgi:hypothetical protein
MLQPLNDLLKGLKKSNALIEWSVRSKEAFRESKRALANATMLAHPVSGAPISLAVDASNFAIGAVLQQMVNNAWQPLGFLTKSLTKAPKLDTSMYPVSTLQNNQTRFVTSQINRTRRRPFRAHTRRHYHDVVLARISILSNVHRPIFAMARSHTHRGHGSDGRCFGPP